MSAWKENNVSAYDWTKLKIIEQISYYLAIEKEEKNSFVKSIRAKK